MACETRLRPQQTLKERMEDIRKAMLKIDAGLVSGRVKMRVGPQGAVVFDGITNEERDGITDACVYRRVMSTGSVLARNALAKAEMLAGRTVDRKQLAAGVHSHDGGQTWHKGH